MAAEVRRSCRSPTRATSSAFTDSHSLRSRSSAETTWARGSSLGLRGSGGRPRSTLPFAVQAKPRAG